MTEDELTPREKALMRKLNTRDVEILSLKSEKSAMNMRIQQLESSMLQGKEPSFPPIVQTVECRDDAEKDFYLQMSSYGKNRCSLCDRPLEQIPNFIQHVFQFHRLAPRKFVETGRSSQEDPEHGVDPLDNGQMRYG